MGAFGSREGSFLNKLMGLVGLLNIGKVTTVIKNYTVLSTDRTIICNKPTALTLTLPATKVGQKFTIKNIGAGTVTVDGYGSDLIDDVLTQEVHTNSCLDIQCRAADNWVIT